MKSNLLSLAIAALLNRPGNLQNFYASPSRTRKPSRDKSGEPYGQKLARLAMRSRLGLRHP